MFKKIMIIIFIPVALLSSIYLYGVVQNNRDVDFPQKAQLEMQLEKSIQWLVDNEPAILEQNNPMLWWMLFEVQKISHDKRVIALLEKYQQRYAQIKYSVWRPLFDGKKQANLGAFSVEGLPYYNQHFIYGLNCAADIERELSIVEQQNSANFCFQSSYIYRPACITHQLMGLHFLDTQQCNLLSNINDVSLSLQQDIVNQLTWDIRVVDVYLQRVLMLLITGAEAQVKPVWIQQVLDHQRDDGGWSGFVSLFNFAGDRGLGFSAKILSLGRETSSFHITAQGIYILSYLVAK